MRKRPLNSLILLSLGLCLGVGCTTVFSNGWRYQFFSKPDSEDAWSPKISGWQLREGRDDGYGAAFAAVAEAGQAAVAPSSGRSPSSEADRRAALARTLAGFDGGVDGLRAKYFRFRADRRRDMAGEFAVWIQAQAQRHYIADGVIDHWATFEETLRANGDDCDGLELLVYHGLRDLGFSETEVYRAIVVRPSDGQHHMVTLWFEDPSDPWVIDPTGAMTKTMLLMSQLPSWEPLKLFSETAEYTVRRERPARTTLAAAPS